MKLNLNWTSRREFLNRIEFWILTTLFVFGMFYMMISRISAGADSTPYLEGFRKAGMEFHFFKNYILPVSSEMIVQFLGFLYMNFVLVPKLFRREKVFSNILLLFGVFLVFGFTDLITDYFIHAYRFENNSGFEFRTLVLDSFMTPIREFVLFGVYTVFKYTALYFITNTKILISNRLVQRDAINAFVLWLISMFILIILEAGSAVILAWGIAAPMGILLYCYSLYSLIPRSMGKKNGSLIYIAKVLALLLIFLFPVFMFSVLSTSSEDMAGTITGFNFFFQFLVTAPLSWISYKRYLKGNEELQELQSELGRSNANLDFLRSQINPHFLFNALNTLYGTALQENAERTGEGIQKLGDMMRFMLQENVQDKISLHREIDYLNNYISLQKLRTDASPQIKIETDISEVSTYLQIAPMLLIPFVENAFKHGISFREPSLIRIGLKLNGGELDFEVYNTKHERPASDPEKNKSGIGLNNVKQRLKLLYADRHRIEVRNTEHEFYIHLTIQLAKLDKS